MATITNTLDGLLTREEAAKLLSCSIETCKRLEKRGKIPRVQLGQRAVRYRMSDLQSLIAGTKGATR
jgi:excisionase family DNA binding protein